jgi:hypothetical protein
LSPPSRRPGGSADGFIPRNEKFCRLHVSTTATYRGLEIPMARYDKPKPSTKILSTRDMAIHAFRIDRACGTSFPRIFFIISGCDLIQPGYSLFRAMEFAFSCGER